MAIKPKDVEQINVDIQITSISSIIEKVIDKYITENEIVMYNKVLNCSNTLDITLDNNQIKLLKTYFIKQSKNGLTLLIQKLKSTYLSAGWKEFSMISSITNETTLSITNITLEM